MMIEDIWIGWCSALSDAWMLARGARLNELAGKRVSRYAPSGLDPYSEAWGRVLALESLVPALADLRHLGDPPCTPLALFKTAAVQAERDHEAEILARHGVDTGPRVSSVSGW